MISSTLTASLFLSASERDVHFFSTYSTIWKIKVVMSKVRRDVTQSFHHIHEPPLWSLSKTFHTLIMSYLVGHESLEFMVLPSGHLVGDEDQSLEWMRDLSSVILASELSL